MTDTPCSHEFCCLRAGHDGLHIDAMGREFKNRPAKFPQRTDTPDGPTADDPDGGWLYDVHTAHVNPATCEKREWGIHCPCWTKRVGPCCACGATADVDPAACTLWGERP